MFIIYFSVNTKTLNNVKTTVGKKKNNSYGTIPFGLTTLTKHLMDDPDQFFDSVKYKLYTHLLLLYCINLLQIYKLI